MASSAVVFVGRVVSGRLLGDGRLSGEPYSREFVFVSSDVLKGNLPPGDVVVGTGLGGGDCGMDFIIGRQYVVYAGRDATDKISTGICSGSKEFVPYGRMELEKIRKALRERKPIAAPSTK